MTILRTSKHHMSGTSELDFDPNTQELAREIVVATTQALNELLDGRTVDGKVIGLTLMLTGMRMLKGMGFDDEAMIRRSSERFVEVVDQEALFKSGRPRH
jgi:hypothetical protein